MYSLRYDKPFIQAIVKNSLLFLCLLTSASLLSTKAFAEGALPVSGQQAWAISIDNDLYVPLASTDRDFTAGVALTYSGAKGRKYWRHLDSAPGVLDSVTGAEARGKQVVVPSIEVGFYGFTPRDIESADLLLNDRPYASLMYLSVSRMYHLASSDNGISTSLTLGVLGSDIVGDIQNEVHRTLGNDKARGWNNQISNGGELTARYQLAYHDYWDSNTFNSRFKTTYFSSVGYITELGVALSTRQGIISSPDLRFNPELISYGEHVNEMAVTPSQGEESYFWGGITLKARLYNAFLQGQFKHSPHVLNQGDLRPIIAEAWLGYTFTIGRQYKASYVIRAQTSEIREGVGDRGHVWGGLVLSRNF